VKGRCPRPLDDGGALDSTIYKLMFFTIDVKRFGEKKSLRKEKGGKRREAKI
jgi:hypothetical protein